MCGGFLEAATDARPDLLLNLRNIVPLSTLMAGVRSLGERDNRRPYYTVPSVD